MIDAHCHLQFFPESVRQERILATQNAGITGFVSSDYDSEHRQTLLELSDDESVFATLGVHPWAAAERLNIDDELSRLQRALTDSSRRIVGIGECGLDALKPNPVAQESVFRAQLGMARELELPVVLHVVKAHHRVLEILKRDGVPQSGGMVHGFTGSTELAREYVQLNFDLSIGRQTISKKLRDAMIAVGVEHLMVESDAPCHPSKKDDQREPSDLICVIDAVARALEISSDVVATRTAECVRKRFRLTDGV